jgi:hypothetical protein
MISTIDIVRQQILAMNADVLEIGLFKPVNQKETRTFREMILRTWDAETLLKSTGWLRLENKAGRNIYVRPAGEHQLSLVDDVSALNIERMKSSGFQPATVVETSPGNFQAWLNHGRRLPKEFGTAAARALAEKFDGDAKAADWRHFGRLAGFTNQKEKHRQPSGLFPYVRLIESTGVIYPQAKLFFAEVQKRFEAEQQSRRDRAAVLLGTRTHKGQPKSIDTFRQNPAYGGDGTRIDLAYALYAVSRGLSEGQIISALRSRDLSHKGSERRQEDYISRTIRKAFTLQETSRSR